jgi:RNA polymerase sigma-70 factor (ECF subfamily)
MQLVSDQSYEAFFKAEYRSLVALGAAMTGNLELAQDLAQDALARAFQYWPKISQYDRAGAWVRRVLINAAIDAIRRRGRESKALTRLPSEPTLMITDEGSDEWWRAVRALPDRQRAAVALYYLEDMSIAEVAHVLDIAEGTVKASLSKARASLATALKEVDAS